jgi:primosomal protein N' (replication factor Y)
MPAAETVLVHGQDAESRWDIYLNEIKSARERGESSVLVFPDLNRVLAAKERIVSSLNIEPCLWQRNKPGELQAWLKIKEGNSMVVLGRRSAIFAPLNRLGLIIVDDEQNDIHKDDQSPHYNARDAAFMRSKIERAKLILGSLTPSLETFYLAKNAKIKHVLLPRRKPYPQITIIEPIYFRAVAKAEPALFSKYLLNALNSTLNESGKSLLFVNRKGFAVFAFCHSCSFILKCPRCNVNLTYYFKDNLLKCRSCNYKMPAPKICPSCNSGYIKYSGAGIEKVESELARIFPTARIETLTGPSLGEGEADIYISTNPLVARLNYDFGLVAILSADSYLNRPALRAAEKTYNLLIALTGLTSKRLLVETGISNHHCFQALLTKDAQSFYDTELKERKQLGFVPYKKMALVKLRGPKEDQVKGACSDLFDSLNASAKGKKIQVSSFNPGQPSRVRGNFCWQILIKGNSAKILSRFLKMYLKKFQRSGIIVTVDIDPA